MQSIIWRYPVMGRARTDIQALRKVRRKEMPIESVAESKTLVELLPSREVLEPLVQLYLGTFETTFRILHVPSFWGEYLRLWESPNEAREGFVVTLLLVAATVFCVPNRERMGFIGGSSVARETAMTWISACDSWLQLQSEKHLTLTYFQVRCLLFLAQRTNLVKAKRHWTYVGTLMRFAVSAGFHRDPSLLGEKISPFDQEMRRRIWATIVELELQASVERGLPSSSRDLPSDCASPLNIDDEDFDESSQRLPDPKGPERYTRTSCLVELRKSLPLRVALTTLINDPKSNLSLDEAFAYEERIKRRLVDIPKWENLADAGSSVLSREFLALQLEQYLLLLFRRSAQSTASESRRQYSLMVCFSASEKILGHHERLMKAGNPSLSLVRDDILQAALSLCYSLSLLDPQRGKAAASKSLSHVQEGCWLTRIQDTYPPESSTSAPNSSLQLLERALGLLQDKMMRLGLGASHYWSVFAAYTVVKTKMFPDRAKEHEMQAADRITHLCYEFLSLQEDYSRVKDPARIANGVRGPTTCHGPENSLLTLFTHQAVAETLVPSTDGVGRQHAHNPPTTTPISPEVRTLQT